MKRIISLIVLVGTILSPSCNNEYDDSTIWQSIYSLEQRIAATETIINAYNNHLLIKSVTPIENGYIITFSDDSKATITNGQNGTDGETYIDYIITDEETVTFKLTDGRSFVMQFYNALSIEFDTDELLTMIPGQERNIHYQIDSPSDNIEIEVLSSADIYSSVIVDDESKKEGYINIIPISELNVAYSKVVVIVSNGHKVIMKRFNFSDSGIDIYDNSEKKVESEGGELELEFISSVEYEVCIPEEASDWVSIVPNNTRGELSKQSIHIQLAKNTGYARETFITVRCPHDNSLSIDFHIQQKPDKDFVQKDDKEALIDLYNALGGNHNDYRWTNWGSDTPLEEWHGVAVDEMSGRVVELHIENCNGAVPSSIGNLTSLNKLVFDQCQITSLPPEIGYLSKLEYLQIYGKYNDTENLKYLPEEIGNIKSLRHLDLRCNNLEYLPKSIRNLQLLEYIDLGFNRSLSGNVLDMLTELKNLKHIDLYEDRYVTGAFDNIINLTQIKYLNLLSTQVSGSFPSQIGNLSNLELLNVMFTKITGSLPASLSSLKNLKVLDCYGTNISGTLPEWIGNLSNLESLDLCFTQIGGNIPHSITNLKKLKQLSLISTDVSGQIPIGLGNIPTLQILQLSDCNLSGTIPEDIANIPSIWLFNNNLSGDIPTKIINSDSWRNRWGLIAVGNKLNLEGLSFPGPNFAMDVDTLDDQKYHIANEYSKNKYTILFQWSAYCVYLEDAVELLQRVHSKYHTSGLKIIGRTYMETSSQNLISKYAMPWETYYSQQLDYPAYIVPTITVIDNSGMVVFSDVIQDRFDLESFLDNEYSKIE